LEGRSLYSCCLQPSQTEQPPGLVGGGVECVGYAGPNHQESVLVFARFRPQNNKEIQIGGEIKVNFPSNEACSCIDDEGNDRSTSTDLSPYTGRQEVFSELWRFVWLDTFALMGAPLLSCVGASQAFALARTTGDGFEPRPTWLNLNRISVLLTGLI